MFETLNSEKIIQVCIHCEEPCNKGVKFCKECTTADNRRAMCNENNKIRIAAGLQPVSHWCGIIN